MRVNHLEAISARLREGVYGVLDGHGGCALEELTDQPVVQIGRERVYICQPDPKPLQAPLMG